MVKGSYMFGKLIGQNVYIHRCVLPKCPSYKEYLSVFEHKNKYLFWNVIKLNKTKLGDFTLLYYKDFIKNPFPELKSSVTIKQGRISSKRIYRSQNSPILHRKELLISPYNKYFPAWSQVTFELEKIGALNSPKTIGHKINWIKKLKSLTNQIHNAKIKEYVFNNVQ